MQRINLNYVHRGSNDSSTVEVNGDLAIGGKTLVGSSRQGKAVLVGGTVTVTTTAVAAASVIHLTRQVTGGTVGHLTVGTVTAGTSFVITSSSGTDTSTIGWTILDPA